MNKSGLLAAFCSSHFSSRPSRCSTALLSVSIALASGCAVEDNTVDLVEARGVNGTFLYVSYNDQVLGDDASQGVYYATRSVGSSTSSSVQISNRGADYYTLQNFAITGENADEFSTQVLDDLVLPPAQVVVVDIAFQPISTGEKSAAFSVSFDTIKQADDEANSLEQVYYEGRELLDDGQFSSASNKFDQYLQGDPATVNSQRAAVRIPIVAEAQTYQSGDELNLFMDAMNLRDEQQYTQALRKLDVFTAMYPDSHLADDAIYLSGYIQLQDLNNTEEALRNMQSLRQSHPDTTYYDTALYSEALAQLELGNNARAENILVSLKERHTGFDALGFQLPKDTLLSRLWFKRADQVLQTV